MSDLLVVQYRRVATAAQAWDEQSLDLGAAARMVQDVSVLGFTAPVAGPAATFTRAWGRHLVELAGQAEGRADGLRVALAAYLRSDEATAADWLLLGGHLEERR